MAASTRIRRRHGMRRSGRHNRNIHARRGNDDWLSVIVFSFLIIRRIRVQEPVSALTVAFFAFFHGYAHGQEMPATASLLLSALGSMLATLLLHGAIDYYYPSRLPRENDTGIADIHFHPFEPVNFRMSLTASF
jgi:hypothetical protein